MFAHRDRFLVREPGRLPEDGVPHHQLAQVVQHRRALHDRNLRLRELHHPRDLGGVERHPGRVALEIGVLGLERDHEGRDGVDQVAFQALAEDHLLEREADGAGIAEQELLLIGQELAALAPREAEEAGRPAHAGNHRRE